MRFQLRVMPKGSKHSIRQWSVPVNPKPQEIKQMMRSWLAKYKECGLAWLEFRAEGYRRHGTEDVYD